LGFGLWNVMPLALGVELAVTAAGLLLYLSASPGRGRAIGMGLTVLVIAGLTVVGGTVAPVPGSINQIAVSGLLSIAVVVALAFALDRGAAILPPAR